MTDRQEPEQQQAELLWRYIEQLKQADNPENVQFVAVTSGERAEVVGLMETAAEAGAWARSESAPGCRREAVRLRLRGAIAAAGPARQSSPAAAGPAPASGTRRSSPAPLYAWLMVPVTARSAGWVVAVAALAVVFWMAIPRVPTAEISPLWVPPASHEQALQMMPALVDGTLDAANSVAVWEHLNRCRRCLQTYQIQWHVAHPAGHPAHQSRLWSQPTAAVRGQIRLSSAVGGNRRCRGGLHRLPVAAQLASAGYPRSGWIAH